MTELNTFNNGSVVQEVLKSNGCTSIEATKSAITEVLTRTERFQERVRDHIDANYVEFMPSHSSTGIFLEEAESLGRETGDLLTTVCQEGVNVLEEANVELTSFGRELREILLGLSVSRHILKIDDLFQCVEEAKATKDYLVVLDLIGRLRSLIYGEGEVERLVQQAQCHDAMKVKFTIQNHLLQQNLEERFERLVQLNCKSFSSSRCVTVLVSKDHNQLQDIAMAIFQARYNPAKLCAFLLENCIEPLILRPVSVEYTDSVKDDAYCQLSLSYSTKDSAGALLRPSYKEVFEHFKLLLQILQPINISVSSSQQVFTIIGDHVRDRLLDLLVNECLLPAVPEDVEDYNSSTLCEDVAQFEQYLADTFLINPEEDSALSKFTDKFDSYYRNKLLRRFLDSAREIMQKDLQDMVPVGGGSADVASNPFMFPRCMVSKSAVEFIKLMELIWQHHLNKFGEGDEDDVTHPLAGVIDILINTYMVQVPIIHKKLLESIPQQPVLFYNNCNFVAHWVISNSDKGIGTAAARVKLLQTTANKVFKVQVDYQESIILDIMSGFEVENLHNLGPMPLKLVRQCLRQFELLKNVWQHVLPENVYNKTFCDLLNTFTGEIIKRIFEFIDISATMASELSDLIDVVLEKAPLLFKDKREVVHVANWMKLEQLKTMMNASMKEITELWCDGAGPLTANFKADQIKHMIMALFQDTDRRAKALSLIV